MPESAYMNMNEAINIFKALSDNTRLRIIRVLIQAGKELCVCEIMDSLGESQYNVSRHLKELKIAGLVKERKGGRWVFYSLQEPKDESHKTIIQALSCLRDEIFSLDEGRLKARLSLRKGGRCVIGVKSQEWERVITRLLSRGGNLYVQKAR